MVSRVPKGLGRLLLQLALKVGVQVAHVSLTKTDLVLEEFVF